MFIKKNPDNIGNTVDQLITMDIAGRGFIRTIYPYVRKRQGEALTLLAAKKLCETITKGDVVLIPSGMLLYPSNLPETDGPLGAAAMARALLISFNAKAVIVTDNSAVKMNKAVCRAAKLNVVDLEKLLATENAISVIGFPIDEIDAEKSANIIFRKYSPKAIIAIECRGRNEKGIYHALPKGRNMNNVCAKVGALFDKAIEKNVLTIGIGDGGNEIGWGIVNDIIRKKIPYGDKCVCGCGGGYGDTTVVDVCVASSISNWGAYGVITCLSFIIKNLRILHDLNIEKQMLRVCINSGAVDGPSLLNKPKIDGISEETNYAVLRILHEIIEPTV